jgi:hypothetical protein
MVQTGFLLVRTLPTDCTESEDGSLLLSVSLAEKKQYFAGRQIKRSKSLGVIYCVSKNSLISAECKKKIYDDIMCIAFIMRLTIYVCCINN